MSVTAFEIAPSDVVAAVRAALVDLQERLWAVRSPEDLLAVTKEIARTRSALASLELQVAVEIDAGDHATHEEQWQSTADFLTETTGGYRVSGRRVLRTGRELAATIAAACTGT